MKINSDFISDVKSKLDIVDVIGAYINLQKAGINYKGICPFHNDSHPSMMVNKARQTYHCFVCGEHGDVLDFLQKYNQITFNEALRIACKLADVEFPEQEGEIEGDSMQVHIESRDTLQMIVHRVPKRFLFFRYGTKGVRMEVVSQNPHSRLSYPKIIMFRK